MPSGVMLQMGSTISLRFLKKLHMNMVNLEASIDIAVVSDGYVYLTQCLRVSAVSYFLSLCGHFSY
jgi:hypothetical protein